MNFFPKRNSFTDLELKFMVTKILKMSWAGRNQLVHINLYALLFYKTIHKDPLYSTRNSIQKERLCDMSTGIDKLTRWLDKESVTDDCTYEHFIYDQDRTVK